ncbi:MAG: HAD family phosphatase, partial [Pseudomonadota bacterium]
MTFDAIVFDMDGLLLDTERMTMEAGVLASADIGLPLDETAFLSVVGIDRPGSLRKLVGLADHAITEAELEAAWYGAFDRMIAEGIPAKDGAHDLLAHLHDSDHPKAIATNSSTHQATGRLKTSGLDRYFETVVGFDLVPRAKPAPDVYVEAARRLGFDPANCLAFEDSDHGARAAKSAGMTVVQIPDLVATDGRHADFVAPDLLSGARM